MRKDMDIQDDVAIELRWEPSLGHDDIAVAVRDGVVTLAGTASSYGDKYTAERVASKVKGVRAVANDIEVKLPSSASRTDPEIAHAAVDALRWNSSVPDERVKVEVGNGWLTLSGEVDWYYQKDAAERAVRFLTGVKGVSNLIQIMARATPSDVRRKIKDALERNARFDANRVTVEIQGNKAILRGNVRSYTEARDVTRAARNAPGITDVDTSVTVDPEMYVPA